MELDRFLSITQLATTSNDAPASRGTRLEKHPGLHPPSAFAFPSSLTSERK